MGVGAPATATAVVQRHEHATGGWLLATRAAARPVAGWVPSYVGYEEWNAAPLRRFEVPHPNITVIVNLGCPLDVHAPALTADAPRYGSFVAGLFDTVAVTSSTGHARGIEMNLTPIATWQLLGVPMHELVNRVVHLADLLGPAAREREEQLHDAGSWDARFDLLDAALTRRLRTVREVPPPLAWAYESLAGRATVGAIATELQWSRRRLATAFREHVGLTPKAFARVIRFDRVVRQVKAMRAGVTPAWSSLAFECGYADQSHLVREFREFAGLTPTEFHRRQSGELPGVSAA